MGDVVEEPDLDAALHGGEERGEYERPGAGLEADVVEGEIERRARLREKAGDSARDVGRTLPAFGEGLDADGREPAGRVRHAVCTARRAALCARFSLR